MSVVRRPVTLTARLVLTVVALVAVISLFVGGVTTWAMASYLNGQLDDDVHGSLGRAYGPPQSFSPLPEDGEDGGRGPRDFEGQGIGTLTAYLSPDYRDGDVLTSDREGSPRPQSLDRDVMAALTAVPADGETHDVTLPGLGEYRVLAVARDGTTVLGGLPTEDVEQILARLLVAEALLALLGVVVAGVGGTVLLRRQLAPLREVAGTARTVAGLPLASGEVAVTDRVPEHLTDDRTEVGQVGAALNSLLSHVEASLAVRHRSEQQVRQFVADASHELRTPLATIRGYSELAQRHPEDAAAVREALGRVEVESERMAALVEDLLLLARLDAGRPLARERVDLTRLLLEGVADARVRAPDHVWRLELPDLPVEVTGDDQRLHQVVTNLLANAAKHTPPGATVTVTADPHGFAVHDDGPGFDAAVSDRAFERFTRGDVARTREAGSSAGLGLALVQAIVAAHGGRVSLDSRPGDTVVRVELPPLSAAGRPVPGASRSRRRAAPRG